MTHRLGGLALAALVGLSASAAGQTSPAAPTELPPVDRPPAYLRTNEPPPAPPLLYKPPPEPARFVFEPAPPPEPFTAGFFLNVQLGLLAPVVDNRIEGLVTVPGVGTNVVRLPDAHLNVAVSPRFEFGYRFAGDNGAVAVGYRFLSTDGDEVLLSNDRLGRALLRSRLDVQVGDFDYLGPLWSLQPYCNLDLRWSIGARLASVYFDSRAVGPVLEQQVSNHYLGAGPRLGLDAHVPLDVWNLGLFSRTEGTLLAGPLTQRFGETIRFDDGTAQSGASSIEQWQAVPLMLLSCGFDFLAPAQGVRLAVGTQYEQWWKVGSADESRGSFWDVGVFFRADVSF